jgi:hypothetical protein
MRFVPVKSLENQLDVTSRPAMKLGHRRAVGQKNARVGNVHRGDANV